MGNKTWAQQPEWIVQSRNPMRIWASAQNHQPPCASSTDPSDSLGKAVSMSGQAPVFPQEQSQGTLRQEHSSRVFSHSRLVQPSNGPQPQRHCSAAGLALKSQQQGATTMHGAGSEAERVVLRYYRTPTSPGTQGGQNSPQCRGQANPIFAVLITNRQPGPLRDLAVWPLTDCQTGTSISATAQECPEAGRLWTPRQPAPAPGGLSGRSGPGLRPGGCP